jgi:serine/threonine protein kinase
VCAGAPVSVKILKNQRDSSGFFEQYTRELEISSKLDCPLISRYLDVDFIGNRYCVITEEFPHRSLEFHLTTGVRLGYGSVLNVTKSLARLLGFAHVQGVAERHVKLDDVLVDPTTGDMRLVKFSTPRSFKARKAAQPRPAAGVVGDLYFVGCTMYRLFCMEYPFPWGQSSERVAQENLQNALRAEHSSLGSQEITRVVNFFTKCTTSDSANRFTTYDEVILELSNLENLNVQILQNRNRAETKSRRKRKNGLLQTAFDTVAALRGDLQAPRNETPNAPPDPTDRGTRELLWGRHRQSEGGTAIWDDPMALKVLTAGGLLSFMGMLLWLIFWR